MNNEENLNKTDVPESNENEAEESEDISVEQDAEYGEHVARKSKDLVAELREKLKKSDEEKREYLTGWQKMKADYINARRQDEESNKQTIKYAEADLIEELIPVLDSFELAVNNKDSAAGLSNEWVRGIEQIRSQLMNILSGHGVEVINPIGQPYDPRTAEAVGMIDTENADEDDTVLSVFQTGYKFHDRVLRPAKVRVGLLINQ